MTSVCSLENGYTFFYRDHPEQPGRVQCGYLSQIEPVEHGMTFQVYQRLIRINVPGQRAIYVPNPPEVIMEHLKAGAEFWVGVLDGCGDAYLATPA